MTEPLIDIRNMDISYEKNRVLQKVSLQIFEKDFIGIIGPNGGGKTSLIKAILGLLKPTSGSITYLISPSEMGYLPQGSQVDKDFPISVLEIVASGLEHGLSFKKPQGRAAKKRIDQVLDQTGLSDLRTRAVGELSGGELQRALLGRAIISTPRLLVLDEPDTHVDNRFELELYELLKQLNQQMTILLVSHDIGMITPYIKTIACVNRDLHYHGSNEISQEQLKVYNCPIEIITHGPVPHRVMKEHQS